MIAKVSENIQRAKSYSHVHVGLLKLFMRLYFLHKHAPNAKKMYPVVHKIKNKDKETSKSKKK